jgi:outer membrane protein assembly factor BamD
VRLRIAIVCALVCLIIVPVAEAKPKKKKGTDCTAEVAKAISRYQKGKWSYVEDILKEVKIQCAGHSSIDTALYYLGKAFIKMKRFEEAKAEFRRLIADFPNSAFEEESHFRIGYAAYMASNPPDRDQEQTRDAMRELNNFLDVYPEGAYADSARAYIRKAGEKLAQKDFTSARFYEKIDKNEAAVVYYRSFLEQFPESEYVPEAKLHYAMVLMKLNQQADAASVLDNLLQTTTRQDILAQARDLKAKLPQSP